MSGNLDSLPLDMRNIFRYPYSGLLGATPCGKNPNFNNIILNLFSPGLAPYNKPVYPNAPDENCSNTNLGNRTYQQDIDYYFGVNTEVTRKYLSCTPKLRFKDGDNNLAISRVILKQSNNQPFFINADGLYRLSQGGADPVPISNAGLNSIYSQFTPITQKFDTEFLDNNILSNFNLFVPTYIGGAMTPFRALMNAGDPNVSHNKYTTTNKLWNNDLTWEVFVGPQTPLWELNRIYCSEANQVSSTKRSSNKAAVHKSGILPSVINPFLQLDGTGINGLGLRTGGIAIGQGGGGVALWSGNPKYVYDGSDYVRFKKLQAKNRNINNASWGGDRNNASQTARSRVRH